MKKIREKYDKKIEKHLTEDQIEKFNELKKERQERRKRRRKEFMGEHKKE